MLCSGVMSILTPKDSKQSAAPEREDAARFPCFATGTPPAAMTNAEVVEMLKELDASPPVPTIYNTSITCKSLVPAGRMPSADAVISSMVSPFMARAVK